MDLPYFALTPTTKIIKSSVGTGGITSTSQTERQRNHGKAYFRINEHRGSVILSTVTISVCK